MSIGAVVDKRQVLPLRLGIGRFHVGIVDRHSLLVNESRWIVPLPLVSSFNHAW